MWLGFVLVSTLGWSLVNVIDSMLVRCYRQPPIVLMWTQSVFTVPALLIVGLVFQVHSQWILPLLIGGATAYAADIAFFLVLDRLDVSVANAAWAILSLYLSLGGLLLFHERWGTAHFAGAALILAGSFALSFWHRHLSLTRTFGMLSLLALAYTPYYLLKKAAIASGDTVLSVFFWSLIARETLAFCLPWLNGRVRRRIRALPGGMWIGLFMAGAAVVASFFVGEYFGGLAFASGPLSLVAMASNVQPFLVIGLAWLTARFLPSLAPRELLTIQSLRVKCACFLVVFVGLALLTLP